MLNNKKSKALKLLLGEDKQVIADSDDLVFSTLDSDDEYAIFTYWEFHVRDTSDFKELFEGGIQEINNLLILKFKKD